MAMCFSNSTIIRASSDSNCVAKKCERSKWLEETLKQTLEALSLKWGQPFDDILDSFDSQMESHSIAVEKGSLPVAKSGLLLFNTSSASMTI